MPIHIVKNNSDPEHAGDIHALIDQVENVNDSADESTDMDDADVQQNRLLSQKRSMLIQLLNNTSGAGSINYTRELKYH